MSYWNVSTRTALICVTALLTCLGLLAIYASSSVPAHGTFGDEFHYLRKQGLIALAGFVFIFSTGHLPIKLLQKATLPLLMVTLLTLIIVHIPGMSHSAKGATRWIRIGPIGFQPAELAKLAVVFYMARYLSHPGRDLRNFWRGLMPCFAVVGLMGGLVLLQPDFGSSLFLVIIAFLMAFIGGMSRKHVLSLIGIGTVGIVTAIAAAPYRIKRFLTFLNPWEEVRGSGFQIIQSFVGFQNGGLLGVGLGESRQKLYFLPDAHTDFILAVIGEELGLLGVLLVCTSFCFYTFLGFQIYKSQKNNFHRLLAFGITCMVAVQACLNMGVTMGLLPTKGIPLPFVSSGASALICFLGATAILARLGQEEISSRA